MFSGTPLTSLSIYESGRMSVEVQGIITGMIQEFLFENAIEEFMEMMTLMVPSG